MPASQISKFGNRGYASEELPSISGFFPGVTIVIPAYNAGKLIERTLGSVVRQTYTAWTVIVVDDGSTDDTCDVVREFAKTDDRIRLIALAENHGAPAGPRNRGVAEAAGDWIAFLDADDIWHPQKLEIQMSAIARHGARFCCTAMQDFANEREIKEPKYDGKPPTQMLTFGAHRIKGRIPASSVVIKASLAREFPFEEDLSYKAVEDYHCWLRVLDSGENCLKINLPLLHYRRIAGQISGSKLKMVKRMYNLHRKFKYTSPLPAALYTATHVAGAIYLRLIKGNL